jgi:hypothetical protein
MDKAQKQLVDTYFRKRAMATEQGSGMHFHPYEINYELKTGAKDINNLPRKTLVSMLINFPQWFDKVERPNILNDFELGVLLSAQPQLIDKFKPERIHVLGDTPIAIILSKQPQLVDRFDLSVLDHKDIADILSNQPSLYDKLGSNKFDHIDIAKVLEKQPSLADKFNLDLLDHLDLIMILNDQPELRDKLKPYMYKRNG